jgi:hypothetical protein
MGWKHSKHDRRLLDLFAAFALLILIVGAWSFLERGSTVPKTANFIVPSQHVHW